MRRLIISAVLLVSLFNVAFFSRAQAASVVGTNLTTSPVSVDLPVSPGTKGTTVLQVQNNQSQPVAITAELKEFTAAGDTGQAQIIDPPAGDPSPSWVHFSPSSFTAQPGVWNKVTMTINVPKTAAFGYYYAVLFVPSTSFSAEGGANAKVKGANAIFVLVDTQSQNEKKQLQLKSFTVDSLVSQYLPANFSVTVHNSGSIYVIPRGYIYISRSPGGTPIDTISVNDGAGNILPGTDRTFKVAWNDGFPVYQAKRVNGQIVSDSSGKPQQDLTWNFDQLTKFRFGNYYARLVMVYSDGTRDIELSSVASFWVIPWIFLGVALLIVLVVGFGIWSVIRNVYWSLRRSARRRR